MYYFNNSRSNHFSGFVRSSGTPSNPPEPTAVPEPPPPTNQSAVVFHSAPGNFAPGWVTDPGSGLWMADVSSTLTRQDEQQPGLPTGHLAQTPKRAMHIRIDRTVTSPLASAQTPVPQDNCKSIPAAVESEPLAATCTIHIEYTPQQQADASLIRRAEAGAREIQQRIGTLLPPAAFWPARVVRTELEATRSAIRDIETAVSKQMVTPLRIESASYLAWLGLTGSSTMSSWFFANIAAGLGSAMHAFCWPAGRSSRTVIDSLRIASGLAAATARLVCTIGDLAAQSSRDESTIGKYLMPALMIGNALAALVAHGRAAFHHKQVVDLDRHLAMADKYIDRMTFVHHGLRFRLDEIKGQQLTYRVEEARVEEARVEEP